MVLNKVAWEQTDYNPSWLWLTYVKEGYVYYIPDVAGHSTDDKGRADRAKQWAAENNIILKWKENNHVI